MQDCRVFVFKEIQINNQLMFQHYRTGTEFEDYIVEDMLLNPEQHWELLEED